MVGTNFHACCYDLLVTISLLSLDSQLAATSGISYLCSGYCMPESCRCLDTVCDAKSCHVLTPWLKLLMSDFSGFVSFCEWLPLLLAAVSIIPVF